MSKSNLFKNTAVVAAFTMLSRVLGLVREMLQSRLVGAGVAQSAFTLAFALPNMSRKLFGEGALTAAFVPVFRGEVESVGLAEAAKLARAVMTTVLLALGAVVALSTAGTLGALAFAPDLSPRAAITLQLVTILLPYMFAICGAAFGMGVLNSLGRFKASSFTSSLLNVVWIAALATLAFLPGWSVVSRVRFVAAAILCGGFIQFAFMLRCMAKAGVAPYPTLKGWTAPKVRLVWRNLGVAAFGAGAVQVNYMLDQVLAQLASPWAAGVIGYAERLMDLPLGVVGVAFGTVLLPTFAGSFARGDVEEARTALRESVRQMMFVMLPAAAGLFVLAQPVTRVIYEGGSFDAAATVRVGRALAVYAVGLGFFGLLKTLTPWFQAQNDMKTPLGVSVVTVCVNAVLNVLAVVALPVEWRHVGLAASTVACAALGCALLIRKGMAKNGSLGLRPAVGYLVRVAAASVLMAAAVAAIDRYVSVENSILHLAVDIFAGICAYAAFACVFRLGLPVRLGAHRRSRKA